VEGVEGTTVGDDVEYEVGFGAVGTLLESVIFQRMMRAIFEHRRKSLEKAFAADIEESRLAKT
jgi:hypothetical protein